jgi:hypothetical protein
MTAGDGGFTASFGERGKGLSATITAARGVEVPAPGYIPLAQWGDDLLDKVRYALEDLAYKMY